MQVPPPQVGDVLRLRVPNITGSDLCTGHQEVTARVVYVGATAVVLEDEAGPSYGAITAHLQTLGTQYDQLMHALLTRNFGNPLAMDARLDANDRIFMLFTKRVNEMGGTALLGFVSPSDFIPQAQCGASNERELFYARVPESTAEISTWYSQMPSTVMHEMKHVTSFAERLARQAALEDRWLEEATAQIAVELWARVRFGYEQRGDVTYSVSIGCELRCPGMPQAMLNHFSFLYRYYENTSARSIFGGTDVYGGAWLFVRWVIDHFAVSEAGFLTQLTQVASTAGLASVETLTGRTFEELLGLWALSLYTDGVSIPVRTELHHPSWNTIDIFRGMNNDFPSLYRHQYPLVGYSPTFGSFLADVSQTRGGSATFFLLTGVQISRQLLDLGGYLGIGSAPEPLRLAIVRLR